MRHVLLVADPGGHLAPLVWLRHELPACTWVSLDTPDVRHRVGDDPWLAGYGPTARSPSCLVRNLLHARRSLRRLRPDLVLSSGAGLGVPWIWAARARGIPTAWLEVADRAQEASLSLRLARPAVDHLLVQHADHQLGDDVTVLGRLGPPTGRPVARSSHVFVSLGTGPHHFPRLVHACEELVRRGWEVHLQHGMSRPAEGCRNTGFLDPEDFADELATAAVVVLHGGVASRTEALAAGRVPVVVPRRASRGEHVDDHQVSELDPIAPRVEPEALAAFLAGWVEPAPPSIDTDGARQRFRRWLDQLPSE